MSFSSNLNCIVGNNGVGKTNILDAVYYLSFCKSYFNQQDANNLNYNADFFSLTGNYLLDERENKVFVSYRMNEKKKMKYNDKQYVRFSEHIGKLPLVIITPKDQELILGQSDLRRKFIDVILSQTDSIYLTNLIKYNKALEQRNTLLKCFTKNNFFDKTAIILWNEQLVSFGREIYFKRRQFVEEFSPFFEKYYQFICNYSEKPVLQYKTMNYETEFEYLLEQNLEKDRYSGWTSIGIHKDDIILELNNHNVKQFASQGQQKSFLLALKLAEFDYLLAKQNRKPILLLDDVFDKLDMERVHKLINLVSNNDFGQVFLTDTNRKRMEIIFENKVIEHKIFEIENMNNIINQA